MESEERQNSDYNDVVETLMNMFGDVMSKDVIFAVVESCGGDSNAAAEAIMNITSETNTNMQSENEPSIQSTEQNPLNRNMLTPQRGHSKKQTGPSPSQPTHSQPTPSQPTRIQPTPSQPTLQPFHSYAEAFLNRGAIPKKQGVAKPCQNMTMHWTDQMRQILTYHNQGARILILMRGAPGSGKSYLAKQIVEITIGSTFADYKSHICSTDDYFMVRGVFQFAKYRLPEAHDWNQNRVKQVLRQGVSPVIIDNTNIEIWEMEPYLREGVRNGYIIEVVEPNTPWAKKAYQLFKRNTHDVPLATIKRKLENYQSGVTGEYLIKMYGLSYPANMVPPVMRNMPAVSYLQDATKLQISDDCRNASNSPTTEIDAISSQMSLSLTPLSSSLYQKQEETQENQAGLTEKNEGTPENDAHDNLAKQKREVEIQKQLEEMERVEYEWETGEAWDQTTQDTEEKADESPTSLEPKPPRVNDLLNSTPTEKLLESVQNCEDWRQISMFMPPWTGHTSKEVENVPAIPVEMKSSSTSMEIGDTDLNNVNKTFKIKTATPRDINLFHFPLSVEKIPEKRMLDKSTVTNELLITEAFRCKNEEKHFIAFRKLFKNIPKPALRDVFDKCCGDVNWAVDIILGGMANNELEIIDNENLSDVEEENQELCDCLAAYSVIPDNTAGPSTSKNQQDIPETKDTASISLPQKKSKLIPSDSTVQLKRQIEKNFTIAENHYSPHCLKIRKMRRGEYSPDEESSPKTESHNTEVVKASTSIEGACSNADSSDDESVTGINEDREKTVNINLGMEFLSELDKLFGRKDMTYPDNVLPRINIPVSLLNEINAFWMESLMSQLDEQDKQTARMIQEDEEFARQLAMKEEELANEGKEPEVPDFKEIMDMDFALSLYQKEVAEWRNKTPTNLASMLSRDKLYNLFPEMPQEVLSELLMAHDDNFQATVEVLLVSTGKDDILKEKNGLNKFVMKKEMERQQKILEEERKRLSEVEWPLLPVGEKVEMSVVNGYREKAERHLAQRNLSYQRANEYVRRGMTQVANYYSDLASFHKQRYEQANSLAAASLMQVHASNFPDNTTIDLHYLRVGEAKESLDLFIDTHIQKLKQSPNRAYNYHTLFFITGRGLHSHGRPRVKPAVMKRLRERGLAFSERNPGLLTAKVCAEDKLSYQVHASNFPDNTTIDLHYLRVGEAKESLDLFIDTHIQKLKQSPNRAYNYHTLFFITGRGLHSHGRPRVKPAVMKRLRERGLAFSERNPGLLTAKVCAEDKLSYQVKTT